MARSKKDVVAASAILKGAKLGQGEGLAEGLRDRLSERQGEESSEVPGATASEPSAVKVVGKVMSGAERASFLCEVGEVGDKLSSA